jgi:hypothetical protein
MNKLLTILIIILSHYTISAQDSILLKNIRENSILLRKNEINLDIDIDNISGIDILDNDIILITYKRPEDGYHFSIYSSEDRKIISRIIPFGSRVDQMIAPIVTIADSYLIITSIQNSNYTIIPFSILHSKNPEIEYNSNFIVPPTIVFKDSLIFSDMFYFEDKKAGLTNNRKSRFMKVNKEYSNIKIEEFFSNVKYNSSSLYFGYLATNDTVLVVANSHYPRVDMFDSNLRLTKSIFIENIEILHYAAPELGNHIFMAPNLFSGCNGICYTDTGFYISYHGYFVYDETSKAESSYILSFDWSGKFLKSFVCTGEIKDLRVIPEENTIYATEKIDDKIKLFKLVIDEQ